MEDTSVVMTNQQTHQQITDLVSACSGYWELRGIAQERREEMRLELEQHLEQAVRDGKSLEAVVGPNPLSFAETWAREIPNTLSRGFSGILRWALYRWLAYVLAFFGMIALFEHLVLRSPTFAFTPVHALILAGFALFGLVEATAGFFSPHMQSRERRELLLFAVYALILLVLLVILRLSGVSFTTTLFRWDWPITVLVTVSALVLWLLRWRFAK
jgi:hypothetical protein